MCVHGHFVQQSTTEPCENRISHLYTQDHYLVDVLPLEWCEREQGLLNLRSHDPLA